MFLAWLALGYWIPSESERIYLLVPPAIVFAVLLRGPGGLGRIWTRRYDLLILTSAVLLVSSTYGMQAPGTVGVSAANLQRAFLSGEVLIAAYFMFSLVLIILCMRGLLVHSLRRVLVPTGASFRRAIIVDLLAMVLLIAVAVPFAISAIFVHRFKVPNGLTPADLARPYENIEFQAADGTHLHGWHVPAKHPSPRTVIFCHGIGANSAAFLGYLSVIDRLDANVFFLDLRGHGQSAGHTVTMGGLEKLDVVATAKLIRERWPNQSRELYGIGVSMGSSALVLGAADLNPPFDAIIIDSGFARATDLADNVLGQFPAFLRPAMSAVGIPMANWEAGCNLRDVCPADVIGNVRCRVLIVHATGDGLIPVTQAKQNYERAHEPKKLWIGELVQHGGVLLNEKVPQACFDFVLGKDARSLETQTTK
jgi:pimeloyl-ACP methyl ester carboxylesterase